MGNQSNRAFAIANDIDEKTVRSIKAASSVNYEISLITIQKLCSNQNMQLSEFFLLIGR